MAVHKISANDAKESAKPAPAKAKAVKAKKVERAKAERTVPAFFKPFVALGGYFKGAWFELREVRWPTRKATWSLTGAVLVFTAFFMVLILLLDAGYKALFETVLQ